MQDSKNKFLSRWLPLSIFLFFFRFSSFAQCPCTDCRCSDSLALVALYDSTNGNNWTNKWVLTQPMTTWFGVTLTNGRVTCIDLDGASDCSTGIMNGNNLVGKIPAKLTELTQLTGLILTRNKLTGTIPNFNLPKLTQLILRDNQLSGAIPNFNLPKLGTLFLSNNLLSGTIPNFSFPNLTQLFLGQNQLSGTIPNFNLPSLIDLNLSPNRLTGAIPNFNFPNLQYLTLTNNQLSGTIPNFNLPNLINLNLSQNQLTGTISNFNLPNLTDLNLGQNQLTGAIPNFNLPNLTQLILGSNQLSGTIPSFNLPNLKTIYLSNNQLSGCLPFGLRSLCSHVTAGNISSNPNLSTQDWAAFCSNSAGVCAPCATPSTPSVSSVTNTGTTISWVAVTNAINYTVEYKTTAATTWTVLAATTALTTTLTGLLQGTTYNVRLTSNCTSGASTPSVLATFTTSGRAFPVGLPTCLEDDFRELEKLYNATGGDNWTNKTGWFSANMATWKGIILTANGCDVGNINLSGNNLIGTIPNFNLPNLLTVYLLDNQLSGSIPNFNLLNIQTVNLGNNQLIGNIPNFNLPNLQNLYLGVNKLTGSIPNFTLPNLRDFSCNNNQLTGNIPNFNQLNLRYLNFSDNKLSGSIPNFNLPNLRILTLQNNKLVGSIPKFTGLNNLETLFLNYNLLDSLPNLSTLPLKKDTINAVRGLRCFSNTLTFDDLLPNIGFLTSAMFYYSPQDTIAKNLTSFNPPVGSTLTIDLGIDGGLTSNKYLWFKNGIRFDSSNQNKLILRGITLCDAGTYKVQVTNPNVPNLTLYSRDIKVTVTGTLPNQRTDTAICAGKTYTLPNGRVMSIATNFRDTLKNRSGCDSLIRIVNLSIQPLPTSTLQNVAICAGQTYILPNGRVVSIATNFRDTLKNRSGCDSLIRLVNLSINPLPVPDVRDVAICPNQTATLQVRNTPNNYRSFQWQNNVSTSATANYTPSVSSTFRVTVTDINGCQGIKFANVTVKLANDTSCITVIPKPKAVNDNLILELNQTKINFNVTTNDFFDRNLIWKVTAKEQPARGVVTDLGKGNFFYQAFPNQRGLVSFRYLLCTNWQAVDYCDSATVTINVLGSNKQTPDAITPNGDGKNDRFIIPELEENPTKYPNNELLILNRWGQVLYQAKPYKNDWEGTNQQNLPLPDGTYYYIMRLDIADGKILTGDLLIIRD